MEWEARKIMKPSQVRPMLRLIGVQPRNKNYAPLILLMLILLLVHGGGGGGGGGGGAKKKLWSVDVCTKQAIQAGIYKKHHHQSELNSTKLLGQPPVICKVILKKTCPASELSGGSTALSKSQGILLGDFLFFKK